MSGSDTSRGINFQYACAISIILDLIDDSAWEVIQLEGDKDIEDISIFGSENQIIERIQVKQKRDPNQWKTSEFRDMILAFAKLPDAEAISYRVIYAGSEGKEFYSKLKPILLKIQLEGWASLSETEIRQLETNLNNEEAFQFLERAQQRFRIEKHDSWEGKRIKDLEKIRIYLKRLILQENNDEADSTIYSVLFEKIASKNEGEIKYSRQITKSELYSLLNIKQSNVYKPNFDRVEYFKWIRNGANLWADSVSLFMQEESSYPEILNLVINVQGDSNQTSDIKPLSLLSIIERIPQVILVGESGSGKTVSLWQIALNEIKIIDTDESFSIPVYIDLSSYDGEQIYELIQNSISASGQQISAGEIDELAKKGELVLLLDNYDHCRTSLRQDLQYRIKNWLRINYQNSAVIVSHSPSDGNNLEVPVFKVMPLSSAQSTKILQNVAEVDNKDIANIRYGLSSDLQYLLQNPLLLKMLVYYYVHSNKQIPRSRSPLYQNVIDGILTLSERKGFSEFDKDLKIKILALIANWMQDNEIYSISPSTITNLLYEWSKENSLISSQTLSELNHSRLRLELLHSGLFKIQLNGNIQFIHSTFMSFLAMYAITEERITELASEKKWSNSILFWTSQVDLEKSEIVFDYLNQNLSLLGQILEERTEKRNNHDFSSFHWRNYFDKFCISFLDLVRQFPILLSYAPWSNLVSGGLNLFISEMENDNFMIYFQPANNNSRVIMVDQKEIEKLQKSEPTTMPLALFLVPKRIVVNYHPLELSYLWILRSLFDHLYFFGQEGGIDVSDIDPKILQDPAFSLVINRFVLFQELCSKLPLSIQVKLPFYATQPFTLVIELHSYASPPFARYAIIENLRPKEVAIIPIFYSSLQEVENRINKYNDGTAEVSVGNRKFVSTFSEDIRLNDLYMHSSGAIAQSWLRDFLQNNLAGFPPKDW